jgi:hypothetical protein
MWVWLILAIVWMAVLGPTIVKKLSNRQFSSVRSFRRLLMLGNDGGSYVGSSTSVPGAVIGFSAASQGYVGDRYYSSGVSGPSGSNGAEGGYDYHNAPTAPFEPVRPAGEVDNGRVSARVSLTTSPTTAVRRRRALGSLIGGTVLFLLVALLTGSTVMWAVALLVLGLATTYVAALIHFHRIAIERAQKVIALETRRHAVEALDERRHVVASSGQVW